MSRAYGIDFGTSSIKVVKGGEGIVLNEKNVIAIYKKTEVRAIGNDAYEMYEKTPRDIQVSFPIKYGVIADLSNMHQLMVHFLDKIHKGRNKKGSDFYIAVPYDITEVEKRSYFDVIASSKIRPNKIKMIEKPVADALGMDLEALDSTGTLIMDIGANTTEISVISLGGIIFSKLVPVGGNDLNDDIIQMVRRKYNFVIGEKTAERVKKEIGSAFDAEGSMVIFGRNTISGLPGELEINASEVHDAMKEHLEGIMDHVKVILERTPPEVSADIYKNGIYVTGGTSRLKDLDKYITDVTGLNVNFSDEPESTVVAGLGAIIESPRYSKLIFDLEER